MEKFEPSLEKKEIETDYKEMSLKDYEGLEKDLSPEDKESLDKIVDGAKNIISLFDLKTEFSAGREPEEKEIMLILTDEGVEPLVRLALFKAAKETGGDIARVILTPRPSEAGQELGKGVEKLFKETDVLWLASSLSKTHSPETSDYINLHSSLKKLFESKGIFDWRANPEGGIEEIMEKYCNDPEIYNKLYDIKRQTGLSYLFLVPNGRILSTTTTTRETLTQGASQENFKEMRERIDKVAEAMKEVKMVHITSELGTDLMVDPKKSAVFLEDGRVDERSGASNFPFGEWASAIDLEGTNGTLIVDGAITGINRDESGAIKPDRVTNLIRIKIEKGKIISVEDVEKNKKGEIISYRKKEGETTTAEKLIKKLTKANEEYKRKNPEGKSDAFRAAELGIGMNSQAYRYNNNNERICPYSSLEAEKALGTIHIAFGRNTDLGVEKEDPDYNDPNIHLDNIVMDATLVGIKKNGSKINILEKGELLV